MPKLPLINFVICEKVLHEVGDIFSVIRCVDLFRLTPTKDHPLANQAVRFVAFVQLKGEKDHEEHRVQLQMVRPDGMTSPDLMDETMALTSTLAGTPGGAVIVVNVAVEPIQMGTHYLLLLIDGQEEAKASFTLQHADTPTEK